MNTLLQKIDFGNEAGDDVNPVELSSYFVEQDKFKSYLDFKKRLVVAIAKKGVGKSALIQWIAYKIQQEDQEALVIKCRGTDLVRANFELKNELKEPNDYIRDWMVRICTFINRNLARELKIAITDDKITLIEAAELDGFKSRNLISCLTDRFSKILGCATPEKIKGKNEVELLRRIKKTRIMILIDDLDATFQKKEEELRSLSTFFTACRYLVQDIKEISIRITMRTDVWTLLKRYDEASDKMQQYIEEIVWTEDDFRRLLYLRIKSQAEILSIKIQTPISSDVGDTEKFYISKVFCPRMEWAEKDTLTYRVIYTLSYHRPRWAIQLCKLAKEAALADRCDFIDKKHIDEIWGDYGKQRIADLVAEHKHQCKVIEELINAFRGAQRTMKRDELLLWVKNHIVTHISTYIDGVECRSPMEIAHFLYRIGFIQARSSEQDGQYEHYHFSEMPDFLSSRTSEDFGVEWEIHPCYREALDITKLNYSQREKFFRRRSSKKE